MALIRQSLLSNLISGSLLRQSLPFELTLGGKLVRDHNAASIVTVPGGTQTLPNDSASGLPAFTQANPARHLTVGATNGIPWFQSVGQGDDADADWLVTASNFDIRKTDIFGLVMQTGGEAFIMGDVVNRRFGFSNGRLRTVKIFETGADDGNRTGAQTHAYNRWYVIHARLAESGNSFIRSFGHGLDGNGEWAELDRITFDGGVRTSPTNMPYFMGSVFSDATGTPRGTAIRANRALVYTHALGIPTDTQVNLLIGVLRSTVDTLRLSFSESISVQASNGEATPIVTGINILSNDPSATSVASVNAAAAPWAASIAGSNGGVFTIGTDGAATFDPGTDFAYDVLGTARSTAFTYTTDLGGGATFTAQVAGGFEPAYVLAPQTDATFYDELGVDKVLLSGHLSIEATVVGTMTRTPGAVGTAHLVFADDASALEYSYTEAPPVDYVGVSLAILVPAGITAGRVVETAAVGGGYFRVEVIGDDLRVEISDGVAAPIGISRALPARDEVFGFTAALGSGGLFLALSGDTAGNVVNASRAGYDAPIAETLRIGGAGAHLYGGQLASPADLSAAEAATAAADVMATYGNQYFWNEYPSIRIHDANNLDSLSQTDGQQVGDWLDISGNNFAAYRQNGGTETGVTVATSNGLKYVQGGGAGGGYLEASADTDLRGREAWVLFQAPSSGRLLSNQENLDFWIRGSHGDIRIVFGKTLYGVTSMMSPYGTTVSANQWYVMRLVFSENNGAELWTDEDLDASRGGGFSSSPTETFKISRLFSDASGNTTVAGAAFIGIFPTTGSAGALTATQVTAAWNELGARRDILNGV
jgi:hypothetical protein